MKANTEVKKALTDLVCYFRGVRNALAAVGIELGFNITNGEDFDK